MFTDTVLFNPGDYQYRKINRLFGIRLPVDMHHATADPSSYHLILLGKVCSNVLYKAGTEALSSSAMY